MKETGEYRRVILLPTGVEYLLVLPLRRRDRRQRDGDRPINQVRLAGYRIDAVEDHRILAPQDKLITVGIKRPCREPAPGRKNAESILLVRGEVRQVLVGDEIAAARRNVDVLDRLGAGAQLDFVRIDEIAQSALRRRLVSVYLSALLPDGQR